MFMQVQGAIQFNCELHSMQNANTKMERDNMMNESQHRRCGCGRSG